MITNLMPQEEHHNLCEAKIGRSKGGKEDVESTEENM
jgi:hypothetical protein